MRYGYRKVLAYLVCFLRDIVVNPLTPSPLLNSCDSQEVEHKEKEFVSFKEIKSSSQAYVDVHSSNQGASYDSDHQQEIRNSFSNFNGNDFEENIDILNLEVQDNIVETEFNFNPLDCFDKLGKAHLKRLQWNYQYYLGKLY
ncbi:hypothetical protein CEXT_445421 [Caerostris extrusa]|uniref:Uncharacterized protein n=1 Tax=Caerostris extrusa TaxID=172846 RepID=A0AAV4UKV3_CAEEX|nr:hypothetical protein CEXT_445421 [Caerostris extrusa]